MKKLLPWLLSIICINTNAKPMQIQSPDKNITVTIAIKEDIRYTVSMGEELLIASSPVSLTAEGIETLGKNPKLSGKKSITVKETMSYPFGKQKSINNEYNELELSFKGNYKLQFRAYNHGVAWRFVTSMEGKTTIMNEEVRFNMAGDYQVIYPENVHQTMQSSFEGLYRYDTLSNMQKDYFTWLPVLFRNSKGTNIMIAESDVRDYPSMHLKYHGNMNFQAVFSGYPLEVKPGGWQNFNLKVVKSADYIAKTEGTRTFPWRVIILEKNDLSLLSNNLVYQLASPSIIENTSWIKPGLVSWDWWNAMNLDNVNFKTGVNNKTYKYFIDFASKNGIPYIILDEGWSETMDMLKIKPDIDLEDLVAYAKEKEVKLILWCVWYTLDRQMDEAFDKYAAMGIAGFKVDFIDRNDQVAMNFFERTAQKASDKKMLLDFHGACSPSGLERTYPNILTREGVMGMEFNKFSKEGIHPPYNVILPYIRNVVGPMDYTPGAMRNVNKDWFKPVFTKPVSTGSRCHQLGMYVIYYSPLQMISDAPTAYEKEPEIIDILKRVPVAWDESLPIEGKLGEYVVIARKSGEDWWIGGMNDWNNRLVNIKLDFINDSEYKAIIYKDGINTEKNPTDYVLIKKNVNKEEMLPVRMAAGGGFLIRLTPILK